MEYQDVAEANVDEDMFSKEAVFLNIEASSSDDVLRYVAEKMCALGYARDGFYEALRKREDNYPTGLPGNVCDIAVPHTDPEYIVKPFVAVVTTNEGVPFVEIGTEDVMLNPRIMFVLGFKTGKYQVKILQTIIELFVQQAEMPQKMLQAQTVDDVWALLQTIQRRVLTRQG